MKTPAPNEMPVLEAPQPSGESQDLFPARPAPAARARKIRTAPELTAARVLCNPLKRKRGSPDKKRLIHLLCLNLRAIPHPPSPPA